MNVVKVNPNPTLQDALDVIDALRKDVVDGKVIGFFVAGLDAEDATIAYMATVRPVTRLRLQG